VEVLGNKTFLYLTRFTIAGEEHRFIARRIIICASEDVAMADPGALTLMVSALNVVEKLG
jgi:putative ATPase